MKLILLLLQQTVFGCQEVCPLSWTSGTEKCWKFIEAKNDLKSARKECRKLGGRIFSPNSKAEYDEIKDLSQDLNLNWNTDKFWIAYVLTDTNSRSFPPNIRKFIGETPSFASTDNQEHGTYSLWHPKVKDTIKYGKNRRMKKRLIQSISGMWILARQMFKSSALCEVEKTCQIAGDKNFCWQPKSSIFDVVEYEGKQSYTSSGVPCTNWNDQTYRKHEYLNKTNHNFCRNPENDEQGPWCYIDTKDQWDICGVPICQKANNEFSDAQATCGSRPLITNDCRKSLRSGNADAKLGQAPFQARVRTHETIRDEYLGSGVLISSCWILITAEKIRKSKASDLRVDMGIMVSHTDSGINKEDLMRHQVMKVANIIFHHQKWSPIGDNLALLQLYPIDNSESCFLNTDSVQPACLSETKPTKDMKCNLSGWNQSKNHLRWIEYEITQTNTCRAQLGGLALVSAEKDLCASTYQNCIKEDGSLLSCGMDDCDTISIYGLQSFATTCAADKPAVFLPVYKYYEWISSTVEKNGPIPFDPKFVCKEHKC